MSMERINEDMKRIHADAERINEALFDYINNSPTAFHAVAQAAERLESAGYVRIEREEGATLSRKGKYYLTKNGSSLIAFRMPDGRLTKLRISAAHSDSPCFKVKETPEMDVEGQYTRLNVEGYGGMIQSTWLDRPLSVAGRVIVQTPEGLAERLIRFDRDLCVIPNLAIHFNREINKGYAYNPQADLLPLFSRGKEEGGRNLKELCANELGVETESILASDLYLYNRETGRRMGANGEFIGSPRLDDLQCAFGTLEGFLAAGEEGGNSQESSGCCAVYALFDNEEIGSGTKQGADSTFLEDAISLICSGAGITKRGRRDLLTQSFLLSADNAHGVHPNHPEKSDPTNRPYLNGGIVLKFQGSQKYTTDAWSAAVVRQICAREKIPCQNFANRSDIAGGSTLGNISSAHVSIPAADIGLAQLAMHSAFETAGAEDTAYLIAFSKAYFRG